MGYIVTIHEEGSRLCYVLNPIGSWSSRLTADPLGLNDERLNKIRIFGSKEQAGKEAARILAGDRVHGPDPTGTVQLLEVDNKPCSECGGTDGVFGDVAHEDPHVCIRILKARLLAPCIHDQEAEERRHKDSGYF